MTKDLTFMRFFFMQADKPEAANVDDGAEAVSE